MMAGRKSRSAATNSSRNTALPITLKAMWMMLTFLALRLAPMEEITAVMQVPMFCPMIMGSAAP